MAVTQVTGTDSYRGIGSDGKTKEVEVVVTMAADPSTGTPATLLPPGRAAAASSVPVVLSTEDLAELKRASAGATVSVASSATAVTLKAANTSRIAVTIANDSTAILYILLGAGTVSTSLYTYALPAKATVASDRTISGFTGIITGIWASANGAALVTELT